MPISENVYSVFLDGRPVHRGLTKAQAYAHAEYYARNGERLKASDKRRFPEVNVKVDKQVVNEEDALYKWAKQGG
jgi:hypothetical protein